MSQALDEYESQYGDGLVFPREFVTHPRGFLRLAACFKFASKMLGETQPVLNLAAGHGFGSWILAQECGACHGVEDDAALRAQAEATWRGDAISFGDCAALANDARLWPALVWFDATLPGSLDVRLDALCPKLDPMVTALFAWDLAAENGGAAAEQAGLLATRFKKVFPFIVDGAVIRPAPVVGRRSTLFLAAGLRSRH